MILEEYSEAKRKAKSGAKGQVDLPTSLLWVLAKVRTKAHDSASIFAQV